MRRIIGNSSRLEWMASLILIVLSLSLCVTAQDSSTGAIRGTVTDPAGARLVLANVVAVNLATGFRYSATSNNEGAFALVLLPPGDYSVRVASPGMSPHLREKMHVDVGGVIELDIKLAVGIPRQPAAHRSRSAVRSARAERNGAPSRPAPTRPRRSGPICVRGSCAHSRDI